MNRHAFAIGMLLVAFGIIEHERVRLKEKLALKTIECEIHKVGYEFYKSLYEKQNTAKNKKEA